MSELEQTGIADLPHYAFESEWPSGVLLILQDDFSQLTGRFSLNALGVLPVGTFEVDCKPFEDPGTGIVHHADAFELYEIPLLLLSALCAFALAKGIHVNRSSWILDDRFDACSEQELDVFVRRAFIKVDSDTARLCELPSEIVKLLLDGTIAGQQTGVGSVATIAFIEAFWLAGNTVKDQLATVEKKQRQSL